MKKIDHSYILRGLLALLCIASVILIALIPLKQWLPLPNQAEEINQVFLKQTQQNPIQLPYSWNSPYEQADQRSFLFVLNLKTLPKQPLYLLFPFFQHALQVKINDALVYDSRSTESWKGAQTYLIDLVLLPQLLIKTGENLIEISVSTEKIFGLKAQGILSPIYIGPLDELTDSYHRLNFLSQFGLPLFGISSFLAINFLIIYIRRPKETVFGWLAGLLFIYSFSRVTYLIPYLPFLTQWMGYFYLFYPLIVGLFLLGFLLALINKKIPPKLFALLLFLVALALALAIFSTIPLYYLIFTISLPVYGLVLLSSVFYAIFYIFLHRHIDKFVIVIGLLLLLHGFVHDIAIRAGFIEDWIFTSRINSLMAILGISLFLTRRQVEISNSLDHSAEQLRLRLIAKEKELSDSFKKQQELLQHQVIHNERRRITTDLHDGVAGHLVTIMALCEEQQYSDEIKRIAKNALMDLRLVMDTLSNTELDLRFTLATFKERCVQPLQHLGIDIQWTVGQLPQHPWTPDDLLNMIRILQEALNNAVRHGQPKQIDIQIEACDNGDLQFDIKNSGGQRFNEQNLKFGLGIKSMQNRAQKLNGMLSLTPLPDGAHLSLKLKKIITKQ